MNNRTQTTDVDKLETGRQFANYVKQHPGVGFYEEDDCGLNFYVDGERVRMSNGRYPLTDGEKAARKGWLEKYGLLIFPVALFGALFTGLFIFGALAS